MSCKKCKKRKNKNRVRNGVKITVIISVEVCQKYKNERNSQNSISLKVKMTACFTSNNQGKSRKRLKTNLKTNSNK